MRWNRMLQIWSGVLVFLQFSLIFWLLYQGPVLAESIPGISIQFMGLLLGSWAIFVMGRKYVKISPLPLENGKIIQKGPYAVLRNPMYLSILLWFLPVAIEYPNWPFIFKLLVLISVLILKTLIEEKTLPKVHKDYDSYSRKTYRIIPWLY